MRFLVDAQLPPALARWIASQGHEAEHVADCGLATASDAAIWDYALRHGAAVVTKDEDFAQRKAGGAGGPQIVWIRRPNSGGASFFLGRARLATAARSVRARRKPRRDRLRIALAVVPDLF